MLGSLTAGLGLAAPFVIYGAALLVAAAVVFVSLRNSRGGSARSRAPSRRFRCGRCCATGPTGPRCSPTSRRAGRRSGCASRWCRCSSSRRSATAPAFAGLALATFAIGNISAVIPSGYLSDRVGRRKLLIVGLTVSAVSTVLVGLHVVAAGVPGGGVRDRRGDGHLHLSAAGRGGRHRRQQGARRNGGRDVPDDGGPRLDRRIAGGRSDRRARVVQRHSWSAASILLVAGDRLGVRAGDPRACRLPSRRRCARSVRRPVAKCRDQRF